MQIGQFVIAQQGFAFSRSDGEADFEPTAQRD